MIKQLLSQYIRNIKIRLRIIPDKIRFYRRQRTRKRALQLKDFMLEHDYKADVVLFKKSGDLCIRINDGFIPTTKLRYDCKSGEFEKVTITFIPTSLEIEAGEKQ